MSELVKFKPKNKQQALAARVIALAAGHEIVSSHLSLDNWCELACLPEAINGVIVDIMARRIYKHNDGNVAKEVATLEAFVEAISKPAKQPKELGEHGFEREDGRTRTGDIHHISLLPDGRVKVGCTYVKKDLMEKLISEYQAYHKEQV